VVAGTNTLDVHYRIHAELGDYEAFAHTYASHLIHVAKPDPAFYRHILDCRGGDAGTGAVRRRRRGERPWRPPAWASTPSGSRRGGRHHRRGGLGGGRCESVAHPGPLRVGWCVTGFPNEHVQDPSSSSGITARPGGGPSAGTTRRSRLGREALTSSPARAPLARSTRASPVPAPPQVLHLDAAARIGGSKRPRRIKIRAADEDVHGVVVGDRLDDQPKCANPPAPASVTVGPGARLDPTPGSGSL
jgi:hypothetical protein